MVKRKRIRGILLYTGLIILCLIVIYVGVGAPALTPEMAMHKAEAMHWVGPSKIIDRGECDYFGYDHYLLGETQYGYCVYSYCEDYLEWDDILSYGVKGDTVTMLQPGLEPALDGLFPDRIPFPVFAIPESAQVVSARLTLTAQYREERYEITETASLEQGACFLFAPDVANVHSRVRNLWYRCIDGTPAVYDNVSGQVTLELFDRQGNLLETVVFACAEVE